MSEEMKLYTQSLGLLWTYVSGKVPSPLYDVTSCWRCPRSPHGSGSQCTGQANAAQTAALVQSTARSVPALALAVPEAHSSQDHRLFPPADKAGFPRATPTALLTCCFHALLLVFSWPCACSCDSVGMVGAHENPPSSCCPRLVVDFLVCTRENQSQVTSIAGDSHLNT